MNDVNSCNEQQKANAYVYMGCRLRTLKFFEQAYCLFYEAFCISHCWNFLNSKHSTRRQVFHNSVLGMVQMLSNDVSRKELNQRSIVAAKSEAELTDICRFMMDRFPEHVNHWADRL